MENPLKTLQLHGQSIWLDYIRRSLITSGEAPVHGRPARHTGKLMIARHAWRLIDPD